MEKTLPLVRRTGFQSPQASNRKDRKPWSDFCSRAHGCLIARPDPFFWTPFFVTPFFCKAELPIIATLNQVQRDMGQYQTGTTGTTGHGGSSGFQNVASPSENRGLSPIIGPLLFPSFSWWLFSQPEPATPGKPP